MSHDLWLWLLAGPNGAGKSTYARNLPVELIINPDDIAREFKPDAPERAALTAGREAMRRIRDLLAAPKLWYRNDPIRPPACSNRDRSKSGRLEHRIGLCRTGSGRNPLGRVRERTLMGGHDVPAADVRRRFERSLQNLTVIYPLADAVQIFDNSSRRRKMRSILEAARGRITFRTRRLPNWVTRSLGKIIGPDYGSR
jgi:predicted ABC-type ATPase